ncbi:SdpI family protein [Williamsia serinedens]|uniref:SdpI/YhfL protein family protein n=1 Tax=Williamsia serinedens TaxID=391736 RepID=A0ABT1H2A1_9NOCA|nr:SdpI family protein [Williamsia serinedens]MCP2159952.1 SdpI/YhfL protein family protein [Williamsia serinedens]
MTTAALVLGVLDAVLAVVVLVVGALGVTRRLPRNRFVGIRTPVTLRSDDAFRATHAVAGPGLLGAGLIAALGAVLGLAAGSVTGTVFAAVAVVAALVIVGAAASFGLRAAMRVPDADDEESSCGTGGCGSCVLAGACGTAADPAARC